MADVLAELVAKITVDMSGLTAGLNKAQQQLQSAGQKMTAIGKQMAMKVTAPIVGIGTAAFKMSGDFDQAFRKVNVMLGASSEEAIEYKKRILEISSATGKSAGDVADAFYQIISAGYRGADSLDILEVAMRGATGGAAEAETTTAALTKAMNIFNLEGVQGSTRAMDIFFGVVDTGLLTFEQMASAFPHAAATAAGLGVSIEETGAALGALTRVTGSTDDAATALNNAFMQLIKPSDKMLDLYTEWGVKTGPEAIEKFGGFEGVLKKVAEATGGEVDQLAELFPSIRALKAVIPLVTTSSEDFAAAQEMVTNSVGRSAEAFTEMAQGPGFTLTQSITKLKNAAIALGDNLAGYITPILEKVTGAVTKLGEWFGGLSSTMQTVIVVGLGLLAALGPVLIIFGQMAMGISAMIGLIKTLKIVQIAVTAVQWLWNAAMTANPIGIIIMAIAALVAAGIALWKNWDKVRTFFENLWFNLKQTFLKGIDFILAGLEKFMGWIPWLGDKVKEAREAISNIIDENEIKHKADVAVDALTKVGEAITSIGDSAAVVEAKLALLTDTLREQFAQQSLIIQEEYNKQRDAAKETYDAEVKAAEESYEAAVQAAKEASDLIKEEYEKEKEAALERYDAAVDAAQEAYDYAVSAINDEYGVAKDATRNRIELAQDATQEIKEQYNREKEAAKSRYDAEISNINAVYDARMAALDDETDATVKAIQAQIDAIDAQTAAEDLRLTRHEEEKRQSQLWAAYQEKKINGATLDEIAEAKQAYEKYAYEVERKETKRARDLEKAALREQIEETRELAENKKNTLKEEKDAELSALEKSLNDTIDYYNNLAAEADQNLAEQLIRIEEERVAKIEAENDKLNAGLESINAIYDAEMEHWENLNREEDANLARTLKRLEQTRESVKYWAEKRLGDTLERIAAEEKAELEWQARQLKAASTQVEDINLIYDGLQKRWDIEIVTTHRDVSADSGGRSSTVITTPPPVRALASGGIINEPTLALMGEQAPGIREAVIPENLWDEIGGGGVVINFTQPVFLDREDTMNRFVDKIDKALQRKYRLRFGGAYAGG